MRSILLVMLLGAALFFAAAYQLGLLDGITDPDLGPGPTASKDAVDISKLGPDLYKPIGFPVIKLPKRGNADPILLYGVLNPLRTEEVPSLVPGKILFIGEQVDDSVIGVAGSAPFLTEPYNMAKVEDGDDNLVKFYRELREGQKIRRDQMVAMIAPAKALGEVQSKIAKVDFAIAERDAAIAGEKEGLDRYARAKRLNREGALAREELGSAELTWLKLKGEKIAKIAGVRVAEIDKKQADTDLQLHEIRAVMPFEFSSIKTIVRQRGYAVKQLDPVMIVQNLEKLQAEALIEEQYFTRIRDKDPEKKGITGTIEPTIVEAPLPEFLPGHSLDVTCVAVAKDRKIVSGGEDRKVCIWQLGFAAPLKKLEHDDAVRVIACTPPSADKNHFVVGCANGSIYVWDLGSSEPTQIKRLDKAHGDAAITSVAFSADGKHFASGASDGSIRLWFIAPGEDESLDAKLLYAFIPENGVKQCHEDAVTSLHFTPQCRLISAGRDKTLRVWHLKEKGAAPDGKPIRNREGNITQLGVSQDGKWMLFDQTGGKTLELLSIKDQTIVHTLNVPVNATPFDTLAIFSPDGKLVLTAGAPEGRLQLWRTPDADSRGFEVRQFAAKESRPVTSAAFSPDAGTSGPNSFAVSASGHKIYLWAIPSVTQVNEHRIRDVPMTLISQTLDPSTKQTRIGFEVPNPATPQHPNGRFEAGRTVTIVIE